MSLKTSLLKNSSINIFSYTTLLVASFFSIPILLSHLGKNLFGIYLFYIGLIPLGASLNFGLNTALIRYLSIPNLNLNTKRKYWRTSLFQYSLLSLLLFCLSLILIILFATSLNFNQFLNQPTILWINLIISIIIFINHLSQPLIALPQTHQNFFFFNLHTLIIGLTTTIFSALISLYTSSLIIIFSLQLTSYTLTFFIFLNYANHYQYNFRPKYFNKLNHNLFDFGFKHFLGNLANQIKQQASKTILSITLSPQVITIFSLPNSLITKIMGALTQLTSAFFPLSSSLINKTKINKLKRLLLFTEVIILCFGILQYYLIHQFGLNFLNFWLDQPQLTPQMFSVLKTLALFFIISGLTPIPATILNSLNLPHIPSLFAIINTSLTLVFIFLFTPKYGALGPAYAITLASFITAPIFLATFFFTFKQYLHSLKF